MSDKSEDDKYIKCSKCRCKYINDDEHINIDFGYNRLEERFKSCVKCRVRGREQNKLYRETHKKEIAENSKIYMKQHYQDHKDYYQEKGKEYRERQLNKEVGEDEQRCTICYKTKPKSDYGGYKAVVKIDGKYQETMIPCRSCNACRDRDKQLRADGKCIG